MVVLRNTLHLLQAKNAIKSALIKKEVPDAEIPSPTAVEELDPAATKPAENESVHLEAPPSKEFPNPAPQDDEVEADPLIPPAPDTPDSSVVETSEGVGAAAGLEDTVPGNPFENATESEEEILMFATGDPYTSDHLDDETVCGDEHLQNLLLKSSLVEPAKETLQPESLVHPVPSPKIVEKVPEPLPAVVKGRAAVDFYHTISVPPEVLSESAIYNRLRRVFQPKKNWYARS